MEVEPLQFSRPFMQVYKIPNIHNKKIILALGAESAGNFSLWENGTMNFSQDFGDLANEHNFSDFKTQLLKFLKDQKIKPDIILSDLHPLFETTKLAQQLAKKYKAQYLPVQHHHAHIFSAVGEQIIEHGALNMEQGLIHNTQNTNSAGLCEDVLIRSNPECCQATYFPLRPGRIAMTKSIIPNTIYGIACDGTGLGTDGKIWGGEVFTITNNQKPKTKQTSNLRLQITRIGHLENQILLGGEMAIQEPARMLIAILKKIPRYKIQDTNKNQTPKTKLQKFPENNGSDKLFAYNFVKRFYTPNEFEVLWSQLEQNFNCLETSSTARVLDAVSVLLGFSNNERLSKHGPIALLEKNSTKPYLNLNPKITTYNIQNTRYRILDTTYLFEYLIKNLHCDKARLAATAQKYIADGMLKIIKTCHPELVSGSKAREIPDQVWNDKRVFASGGMMNNKIISEIMEKQGFYLNKKIPRGDAGLSFGQIMFYLLTK